MIHILGARKLIQLIISLNYESKVGYEIEYFFREKKHNKSQIYKNW